MKSKVFLTSAALVLATAFSASAMCGSKSEQAASCAEGTVWDHQLGTCVSQTTS